MRFEGVLDRSDWSEFTQAEAAGFAWGQQADISALAGAQTAGGSCWAERSAIDAITVPGTGGGDRADVSTGSSPLEAVNRFLPERGIAEYDARIAVAAEQTSSAFVRDATKAWEPLCIQEDRTMGNDNTAAWGGRRLRPSASRLRPHFTKPSVRVYE